MKVEEIALSKIMIDENQPRKLFDDEKLAFLIQSIKKYGIQEPLKIEEVGNGYLLVDGERRFRAARELKMPDVPCIVLPPSNKVDRLVKQFHIQDKHEDWTPTEKAFTVWKLSEEMGINVKDLTQLLGMNRHTVGRYLAFSAIIDKRSFERSNVPLNMVHSISGLKNHIKKVFIENDIDYTRTFEKDLENAIFYRVKNQMITKTSDYGHIKDAASASPKNIFKFIENKDLTVDELFTSSKAKGAYYIRRADFNAGYLCSNIQGYLKYPDAKFTEKQISNLKRVQKNLQELLDFIGE
jgi:ParB/RepB/Spo0J family partition protein